MSSVLPEDVLYLEIFPTLPVKSLLTCKCVCKSWSRIISDPNFIKIHNHHLAIENNNDPSAIVVGFVQRSEATDGLHTPLYRTPLYCIHYDTPLSQVDHLAELDYPSKSLGFLAEILDSTNGLFCLFCHKYLGEGNREQFFCLWNPATKAFQKLPASPYNYDHINGKYGFGYDCKTDDYKLVIVHQYFDSQKNKSLVEVYTYALRTNSWKDSQTLPYAFFSRGKGVLMNGALHWIGIRFYIHHNFIISFDVKDEKFIELQLPAKFMNVKNPFPMPIGVLQGCLCILVETLVDFEVWVMKDYGVQESWTKHYSIARERVDYTFSLSLMWSFKNGKILLRTRDKLVLYDPKDTSATELMNFHGSMFHRIEFFVESLVSPNSNTVGI